MKKFDEAIDRIRTLECPTGELENRIAEILQEYGAADKNKVKIIRDKSFDRDDAQAYSIEITDKSQQFEVFAKSGFDDYVAKVVEVYNK